VRPTLEVLEDRNLLSPGPRLFDRHLRLRTVVGGLDSPTTMAFLGANDFLVLEKNSGRVEHVVNGVVQGTVLDLAVNNFSERGLLGIALDPHFATNHFVYLDWTASAPPTTNPLFPSEVTPPVTPQLGVDTSDPLAVPLLGNRVDRFVWDTSTPTPTLRFDRNLIVLRAFQNDSSTPPPPGHAPQGPQGNHNGGVLAFGPDGELYVFMGDNGRRGALQNLPFGPKPGSGGPTVPDDQFGGPLPDNAHLTGVVLRLNPDGTTPTDNPFYQVGAQMGGEAGANLQKVFSYGRRNSFGLAFDPVTGALWESEAGDDTFDEINRVEAGSNGGWIQDMGPLSRLAQYRGIESTFGTRDLQQLRWPPTDIARGPRQALGRLWNLPGSFYSNPEFSWKYAVTPAGLGFVTGMGLGPRYAGNLFVGFGEDGMLGGPLVRFRLTPNRLHLVPLEPGQRDRVADNTPQDRFAESRSLLVGKNFGIVTDVQTGPDGNLYVVSFTNWAVYTLSGRGRA
jgi:glucose/arabinose dehydrogenase